MNKYSLNSIPLLLTILAMLPCHAATLLVPEQFPTIQAGVDAAAVGDTVSLKPDLYFGEGNRDIDFGGKDLVLRSRDNDPSTCIIACQGSYWEPHRGFIFQSGETSAAVVQGLTITGGFAPFEPDPNGGGILCTLESGSSPTIRNCRITHCFSSEMGGGMFAPDGFTIVDCRFDNNWASVDGGGLVLGGITPSSITNCLIDHNYIDHGSVPEYSTGGLLMSAPSPVVFECTFANNSQTALKMDDSGFYSRLTIVGNEIGVCAGGASLSESILAFNEKALAFDEYSTAMACCNIFGNGQGDWTGAIAGLLGVSGNISLDPLFCDMNNWDYHVAPASPCLASVCGQIGSMGVGSCSSLTPAGDDLPMEPAIQSSYPNPFNPSTTISYFLPEASPVNLTVYDIRGKRVKNLFSAPELNAGPHAQHWAGRDEDGRKVAAGIYLVVLETDRGKATHRMALIK